MSKRQRWVIVAMHKPGHYLQRFTQYGPKYCKSERNAEHFRSIDAAKESPALMVPGAFTIKPVDNRK